MKFLEFLIPFLMSQGRSLLQTKTEALSHHIVNNARQVAILLAAAVISISLFCIGFSMAYTAWMLNISHGEMWVASAPVVGGWVLCLISTVGLVYSLGEKRWMKATGVAKPEAATQAPAGPTIETAITLILIELANELKEKRIHDSQAPTKTPGQAPLV